MKTLLVAGAAFLAAWLYFHKQPTVSSQLAAAPAGAPIAAAAAPETPSRLHRQAEPGPPAEIRGSVIRALADGVIVYGDAQEAGEGFNGALWLTGWSRQGIAEMDEDVTVDYVRHIGTYEYAPQQSLRAYEVMPGKPGASRP